MNYNDLFKLQAMQITAIKESKIFSVSREGVGCCWQTPDDGLYICVNHSLYIIFKYNGKVVTLEDVLNSDCRNDIKDFFLFNLDLFVVKK